MNVSRSLVGALCALGFIHGMAAGAELSLVPISASGSHTLAGDEIILDGAGQRVLLEIHLADWDPDQDGSPLLSAWQTRLDSSGYSSGLQGTLTPAVVPCTPPDNSPCVNAFGLGATCFDDPFTTDDRCTAGFINTLHLDANNNFDYVLCVGGSCGFTSVDISTPDFGFLGATNSPVADPGAPRYCATLVVDVPAGAAGTFTIGFLNDSESVLLDETGFNAITPLLLTPAKITIRCASDADCNDGNACTDDSCEPDGTCLNTETYNPLIDCCDPISGSLTTIDDGNECTDDICNPDGSVDNPPFGTDTPCTPDGNVCTDDFCDGAGGCGIDNTDPCDDGTFCNGVDTCAGGACSAHTGDPCLGGPECADTCDETNDTCNLPFGTDCTPDGNVCTDDVCDGAGVCGVDNTDPCDDGLCCNVGETCTAGVCSGGAPRDCDDGITCTTDTCEEALAPDCCANTLDAGFCLISGVCYSEGALNPANDCEECNTAMSTTDWSFRTTGSPCDDGDPCTGTGRPGIDPDTCDGAGTCSGETDPECNDQCAFAVAVTEGVSTGNNNNQSPTDDTEVSCQLDSNNDVWFEYTASCDGTVFVSTTGSQFTPSNDPVLSVHDACPDMGGSEIACDDDSGEALQAALTFVATAGTPYWIRVAGFEDNTGDIVLNIVPFDECLIDGVCYAAGSLNPGNDCEACLPVVTSTDWSSLPEGAACGNGAETDCDNPDACDGAGVCESNFKPDGTECTDEGNECTFDECGAGLCTHPPRPSGTPCGDPAARECDDPDTCNGASVCSPNNKSLGTACGNPTETTCDLHDICDGTGVCDDNFAPGGGVTPCDDGDVCTELDTCDGAGACLGQPIPQAPLVISEGSRHLTVTPQPAGSVAPVALRLTSPDWTCLDSYISAAGQLVAGPVIQLPDDWGTVLIISADIVPESEYTVVAECGAYVSAVGSATTSRFGDCVGPFDTENGVWPPPDGQTNLNDILAQLQVFSHLSTAPDVERVDLWPCVPDGKVDLFDVVFTLQSFQGISYVDATDCPLPCP